MRLKFVAAIVLISTPALAGEYVQGYVKKDGTYVEPHYRSSADSSRNNNYSAQGNSNPYTGEKGSVNPYAPNNTYGLNYLGPRRRY